MKNKTLLPALLIALLPLLIAPLTGTAQSIPTAHQILQRVQQHLPPHPLQLSGKLYRKAPNGYNKVSLPLTATLRLGNPTPTAQYQVDNQTLTLTWSNGTPHYHFSNPALQPHHEIAQSGMNWNDLSLAFLWWPNARLLGETTKINRHAWLIEIPVPNSTERLHLWIEKEMAMLLEAQWLDAHDDTQRTLRIKRIRKIDDLWIAKQLEIIHHTTGERSVLYLHDIHQP
ncbi:MAG: outer membrane lipoprotein-sorting protein [Kiritimatiellaceae bacterium]|nr:MAG: outer membrane lipoprotein-sorting protein [Kiritimatiellaceae bacterium]